MSKQESKSHIEAGDLLPAIEDYIIRNAKAACVSLELGNTQLRKNICRVVALAIRDSETRKSLIDNPAATLAKFGADLPAGVSLQVHERRDQQFHISLPPLVTKESIAQTFGGEGIEIDDSELKSNPAGTDLLFKDDTDVGDMTGIFGWDSDRSDPHSRD